jgi:hypothetical protein
MRAISAPPRRPEQLMRMPFGAETHRRLHRALHGAAEGDAALELLGDRFGDQVASSSGLRISTMLMTTSTSVISATSLAQLLDVGALLADHHARTRRVDRDAALLVRTLDHDAARRRLLELLVQDLADLDVLMQQLAVLVLAGEPAANPRSG